MRADNLDVIETDVGFGRQRIFWKLSVVLVILESCGTLHVQRAACSQKSDSVTNLFIFT